MNIIDKIVKPKLISRDYLAILTESYSQEQLQAILHKRRKDKTFDFCYSTSMMTKEKKHCRIGRYLQKWWCLTDDSHE